MSALKYTAGARTRNVVNLAKPGGTDKAYELTAAQAAPSSATHGFKNFHSQDTLHVVIHNNGLDDGGSTPVTIAADQITIWVYNSSLGGVWTQLRLNDRKNGSDAATFPVVTIPDTIAKDSTYKLTVPIEGAERIAVQVAAIPTRDRGTLDIYLGVNTI